MSKTFIIKKINGRTIEGLESDELKCIANGGLLHEKDTIYKEGESKCYSAKQVIDLSKPKKEKKNKTIFYSSFITIALTVLFGGGVLYYAVDDYFDISRQTSELKNGSNSETSLATVNDNGRTKPSNYENEKQKDNLESTVEYDVFQSKKLVEICQDPTTSLQDIKEVLASGADINFADGDGGTALLYACSALQNHKVHVFLLENGANHSLAILSGPASGSTPLMVASMESQNPKVISALILAGADIDYSLSNGTNSLMIAAMANKNPEITRELLESGADIDSRGPNGTTALMLAAEHNTNPEVCEVLLEYGANWKASRDDGRKAGGLAIDNENQAVLGVFLKLLMQEMQERGLSGNKESESSGYSGIYTIENEDRHTLLKSLIRGKGPLSNFGLIIPLGTLPHETNMILELKQKDNQALITFSLSLHEREKTTRGVWEVTDGKLKITWHGLGTSEYSISTDGVILLPDGIRFVLNR